MTTDDDYWDVEWDGPRGKDRLIDFGKGLIWPFLGIFRFLASVGVVIVILGFMFINILSASIVLSSLDGDLQSAYTVTPDILGMAYTEVSIPTADGLVLPGWWIPGNGSGNLSSWTFILVHGWEVEQGKVLDQWGPELYAEGASMLTFDLRGHGSAPSDPTHQVGWGYYEQEDVRGAVSYLLTERADEIDASRVVVIAESMAGAATLLAAPDLEGQVTAYILDSPLVDLALQVREKGRADGYPDAVTALAGFWFDSFSQGYDRDTIDGVAALSEISAPMLVFHCTDDTKVEPANSAALQEAAPSQVTRHTRECGTEVNKRAHVAMHAYPEYWDLLTEWVTDLAPLG